MTANWTTLFEGSDLEAYMSVTSGHSGLAISFDQMNQPSRPPNVYGASFFRREGFDQIHIVCKEDTWYQTKEFFLVTSLIAKARVCYDRVLAYGNSMGAYGALMISGPIDVDTVIAFAPQYSVNPKIVPEEKRWLSVTSRLVFRLNSLDDNVSRRARIFAVFDPVCSVDMIHIRRLEAIRLLERVKIPLSGHYPASLMKEAGVLDNYMSAMVRGAPLERFLRVEMRARRRGSASYFRRLAQMLNTRNSLEKAIHAATIAYSLDPYSAGTLETIFEILSFAPQYYAFGDMAARLLEENFPSSAHYKTYRQSSWARLENYGSRK